MSLLISQSARKLAMLVSASRPTERGSTRMPLCRVSAPAGTLGTNWGTPGGCTKKVSPGPGWLGSSPQNSVLPLVAGAPAKTPGRSAWLQFRSPCCEKPTRPEFAPHST